MQDAVIPMSFAGGGPYIIRKKEELVGGCLKAIIDILALKFGFMPSTKPAKNFKKLVESVSLANTGSYNIYQLKVHLHLGFQERFSSRYCTSILQSWICQINIILALDVPT